MKKLINYFSLVTLLILLGSCEDSLTNTTYSAETNNGGLFAIRCYDNGKVMFANIEASVVNENPILYMALADFSETTLKEYQRDGKTIKLSKNGIIDDAFIFEDGVIKWQDVEFKPDSRFSTIKKSGKYGGTVYKAEYEREILILAFIDENKVCQLDISKRTGNVNKILCNYEIEDKKVFFG